MRTITLVIIHCSAVRPYQTSTAAQIDSWHRARGWNGIGYHYVIYRDGSIRCGRNIDSIGAHCQGHNTGSIGICYIGGVSADGHTPKDTRTPQQRQSLRRLVDTLQHLYLGATVHGHNDYAAKACPSFRVETDL